MVPLLKKVSVFGIAVALALGGCGRGSNQNIRIDGISGPNVAFVNGMFTASLVVKSFTYDTGVRIPIPHMPNSFLEAGPDLQSSGFLISMGLSATDIASLLHMNPLDPSTLPGGRPLPGVVAGRLPGLAVPVPKFDNVTFYVGSEVMGVFVPVKFGLTQMMGTFRFYDATGTQIGNISIVGSDTNGKNSGLLLLIELKGKVQSLLQDSLDQSSDQLD